MSSRCPSRSGVRIEMMIPPYVIARTSTPCSLVSVNSSTVRPSGSLPNGARVTLGVDLILTLRFIVQPRMRRPVIPRDRSDRDFWNITLAQREQHGGIQRVAAKACAVDREPSRKRIAHLELQDQFAAARRRGDRGRGNRHAQQLAVRSRLIQMSIVRLRVP